MTYGLKPYLAAAFVVMATPLLAQSAPDPVVETARRNGLVGEQADGYLGFAAAPSDELKAHVNQVNTKRRAIYTDLAAKRGVTVNEVAAATGCELLQGRVAPGERYRDESGTWQQRQGNAAVKLPSYCG